MNNRRMMMQSIGGDKAFILEVNTALGDGLNQMRLPIQGTNMDIDWGDGTTETVTQTDLSGSANWVTHSYASGGIYDIKISNTIEYISFAGTGDKDKIVDVKQWGSAQWTSFDKAFRNCDELVSVSATDAPNLENVTTFGTAFFNCDKLEYISMVGWDTSNVENFTSTFRDCPLLKKIEGIENIDTSSVTSFNQTLRETPLLKLETLNWNVLSVTDFTNFAFNAVGIELFEPIDYSNSIVNFEASLQAAFPNGIGYTANITVNFGISQYIKQIAQQAYDNLVNVYGWTIIDGGGISTSEGDLVIELGQSNMAGRDGDTSNVSYPFESTNGFFFNGTDEDEITTTRGNATTGSHANYFCEEYFSLTGRKAIMVEKAIGGSSVHPVASPNWSSTGLLRGATETLIQSALDYYGKTTPKYCLWSQGERDALILGNTYGGVLYTKAIFKSYMQDVINWWQNLYPNVPFLISQTGVQDPLTVPAQNWIDIQEAQAELATENTGVYLAFSNAKNFPAQSKMVDEIHYNFEGYQEMGEAFANYIVNNSI